MEKTLFNLISALEPKEYAVTLFVFEKVGKFCDRVPQGVRLVDLSEQSELYARINFKSREKFFSLLKAGRFLRAARLLVFEKRSLFMLKRYPVERLYRYYSRALPQVDEAFDMAVDYYGYGDYTTAFVIDKLQAKVKVSWLHDEKQPWADTLESFYICYDAILGCSRDCVANFVQRFPGLKSRAEVFYNLIDTRQILEKSAEPVEMYPGLKLVTVGRLAEQKGYDIAIAAAALLKDRKLDFRWYFVGSGPQEMSLRQQADALGVSDRVVFCGFQSNPYKYMKNCDLYLQPSRHEGYCTTITEALVLGCGVVASDVSGVREQLTDGETGVILPELSARTVADAVTKLAQTPRQLAEIRAKVHALKIDFGKEIQKLARLMD